MTDGDVRRWFSRTTIARLAGVDRHTLARYDLAAHAVGETTRAKCAAVYEYLRLLIQQAPGAKKER